jgi:hypothetical protein
MVGMVTGSALCSISDRYIAIDAHFLALYASRPSLSGILSRLRAARNRRAAKPLDLPGDRQAEHPLISW